MMEIRGVTDDFAVAGQLRPEDIPDLAERFSLLINNRPDDEEPGQPAHPELAAAAEAAGVAYVFIPVRGAPTGEQVRAVQEALRGTGPTLAFCRTGQRSIITWAVGQALDGRPVEALITEGAQAGYDLASPLQMLLPRLRS